jgi:hypothetical protein
MAHHHDVARKERLRAELIAYLGGKCVKCGTTDRLEFDHKGGDRDWEPTRVNQWTRMKLYWRDARAGKLRLLCKPHNASDGGSRAWKKYHIPQRSHACSRR